jgi:hypothetical protein
MNDDQSIQWMQVSPFAIHYEWNTLIPYDGPFGIWHAGCVRDVLVPPGKPDGGELLVATDTGGVWLTRSNGTGISVSDFDKPDMWCLSSFGAPGNPSVVYAGGTGLHVSATPTMPFSWTEIPLNGSDVDGNRVLTGTVFRMAVMSEARVIVLACGNGVFWSPIPADPQTGPYVWRQAVGLPSQNIRGFFGLALGDKLDDAQHRRVLVTSWGTADAPSAIFEGAWDSIGQLLMHPTVIHDGLIQLVMRATSLASCDRDPIVMYAVSAGDDGKIVAILKSIDGGLNWKLLSPRFGNPPSLTKFIDTAGGQGNDSRPCNAIAVSRHDPNTVAIAWRHEGLFISSNGGTTWRVTPTSLHLHSDLHTVYFDPTDASGQRIYTGGDGGLVLMPDLGVNGDTFVSSFNRQLLNLQFQSPIQNAGGLGRSYWGTCSASTTDKVVAGGLQDNGNVYCVPSPVPTPWFNLGPPDDGELALFTNTGHLLSYYSDDAMLRDAAWDPNGNQFFDVQIPPVTRQDPHLPTPVGLYQPVVDIVKFPFRVNERGQFMYAVAGLQSDLFGLFSDSDGTHPKGPVSGVVTSPTGAGQVNVSNLAPGAQQKGSLDIVAPGAGTGVPIKVEFFVHPAPVGVEFPPADADDTINIDVAGTYLVKVDRFHISKTRSQGDDTDFVGLQVRVNDNPIVDDQGKDIHWRSMHNVNDGNHEVDLGVGPFTVVSSDRVGINYQVVNHGFNLGGVLAFFDAVSAAAKEALGNIFAGTNWTEADKLTQLINKDQFANCDGMCALDVVLRTGAVMHSDTERGGVFTDTRKYPGNNISPVESDIYTSADGCGASPSYQVTYSIHRLSFRA